MSQHCKPELVPSGAMPHGREILLQHMVTPVTTFRDWHKITLFFFFGSPVFFFFSSNIHKKNEKKLRLKHQLTVTCRKRGGRSGVRFSQTDPTSQAYAQPFGRGAF